MNKEKLAEGLKKKPMVVSSLPFSDEELDKYFEEMEDYMFFIDLDKTDLDAHSFVNYVYNANITCDIKIDEVTPENTEKLNELLLEYIKTDKLVYIDLLSELWGSACLHIIYPELTSPVEEIHIFITQFIEKNRELVEEVTTAVVSLYYYLLGMMIDRKENSGGFPAKKLSENIGANIVNLRRSGNFWSVFMNIADYKGEVYNFEDFSSFKYDGCGIAQYFFNEFGPFSSIVEMNNAAGAERKTVKEGEGGGSVDAE